MWGTTACPAVKLYNGLLSVPLRVTTLIAPAPLHPTSFSSQRGWVEDLWPTLYKSREGGGASLRRRVSDLQKILSSDSAVYAGLNFTSVYSGVTSSKNALTGISTLICSGLATMLVVIRGPSFNSTIAST